MTLGRNPCGDMASTESPQRQAAPTGLPRPFLTYHGHPLLKTDPPDGARLPSPWIAHSAALENSWAMWDERSKQKLKETDMMLCQVCGLELGETKFFGFLGGGRKDENRTSGSGMHLKCGLIAAKFCPHLIRRHSMGLTIGFIYSGPGSGLTQWEDDMDFGLVDGAVAVNLADLKEAVKNEKLQRSPA